jgi:prophage regulatory protein
MLNADSATGATAITRTALQIAPPRYRERFLSVSDVSQMVKLCKTTIYKYVQAKMFPEPVATGPKRVAWLESEVLQWMNARIEERDRRRNSHA